jgi:hypothetical protein
MGIIYLLHDKPPIHKNSLVSVEKSGKSRKKVEKQKEVDKSGKAEESGKSVKNRK